MISILHWKKNEVVNSTRKRVTTLRPILIGELCVQSKSTVKYLDLMLDSKMSFFEQIKAAVDRTVAGVLALNRLMANVESLVSTSRSLLLGATQPVLLYVAEVWADALDKVHRKCLAKVQKPEALRVTSAHSTVVMMITEVIPVALLAKKR